MTNPLVAALTVSGIGMLMLFVAMGLLYGLMYGMTALIKDDRPASPNRGGDPTSSPRETQIAAAIAVALARAEREMSTADAPQVKETNSAWWRLHHQRQLTNSNWRMRGN
jgi:Na+-transporting methylmalonyl-CoA/oxaloacetate decarboxylase gamma subunit